MENRKYKIILGVIGGLTIISGGMFVYQNFFYDKIQEKNKINVYVAKTDIPAHTKLKADMFTPVAISKNNVIKGYLTDIKNIDDQELKGGLLQGEALIESRINTENDNLDENMVIQIEPDFVSDIKAGDNARIYVQLINKNSGEITVKELFNMKKIQSHKDLSKIAEKQVSSASTSDDEQPKYYIKVTEKEVQDYYSSKAVGKIIITRLSDLDSPKRESNFNKDDKTVKESANLFQKEDKKISIMKYKIEAGDTLESLSFKFKTNKENILKLNDNKSEFIVGEEIQVPAQ